MTCTMLKFTPLSKLAVATASVGLRPNTVSLLGLMITFDAAHVCVAV